MMKTILIALIVMGVASVFTSPVPTEVEEYQAANDEEVHDFELQPVEALTERANRQRRVTCDLFSISLPWGSVNHAACAAHCLANGRKNKGGRCINGVCICRK